MSELKLPPPFAPFGGVPASLLPPPYTAAPSGDVQNIAVPMRVPPHPQPDASSKSSADIWTAKEVAKFCGFSVDTLDRRVAKSREAVARGEPPTFPLPLPPPEPKECSEGKPREWDRDEVLEFVGWISTYGVEDLMRIFKVETRQTIYRWVEASRRGNGWLPLPLDTGGGERSKLIWRLDKINALKGIKGKRKPQSGTSSNSETGGKIDEEVKS